MAGAKTGICRKEREAGDSILLKQIQYCTECDLVLADIALGEMVTSKASSYTSLHSIAFLTSNSPLPHDNFNASDTTEILRLSLIDSQAT